MTDKAPTTTLTTTETPAQQISRIASEANLTTLETLQLTDLEKDLRLATAVGQLRQLFSGPLLQQICDLAGTPIGFLTDRDREQNKYPPAVIRDVAVEAVLFGARFIRNEINVISGKCYLAKSFYKRKLFETVADCRIIEGVPEIKGTTAYCPMVATFTHNGTPHRLEFVPPRKPEDLDTRIQVRVNAGMGPDGIAGKAYKKLAQRIYEHCTATTWLASVDPADDVPAETAPRIEPPRPAAIADGTLDTKAAYKLGSGHFGDQVSPVAEIHQHAAADVDPETGEEIPADVLPSLPQTHGQLLADLARMAGIRDVNEYRRTMKAANLTEAQTKKLDAACDSRIEEIRASRGPRTNETRPAVTERDSTK